MKRKILKIGIIISLICMLMVLTGCGNQKQNQNETQEVEKNSKLSEVQVGDYVSYKAEVGKSYTAKSDRTGYSKDQEVKVKGDEKWRVFKVNDNGTVDLISANGIGTSTREQIQFVGENGYNNAQNEINNMVQIYGTNEFAESVRTMNEEDVKSLINLKDNVVALEEEYKIDLSDCETDEDLWKAINQAEDQNYQKEFTINGENIIDNTGIDSEILRSSKFDKVNLNIDSTAKKLLDYKEESDGYLIGDIWLGEQKTRISEVGYNDADYKVEQGISYYYYSGDNSISLGMFELYTKNFGKDTQKLENEYDGNGNAYIRPIVIIKKDVKIDGGTGTETDPYILK